MLAPHVQWVLRRTFGLMVLDGSITLPDLESVEFDIYTPIYHHVHCINILMGWQWTKYRC